MDQTAQQVGNRLVVEDSIDVKAPIQMVYNRWDDFTRFPDFMSSVEEVRPLSGNRYHWVARIFGIKEEWDAEVTEREPDRRIAWRSISGAQNAGTVSFSQLGPDRSEVRVRFEYTPPADTVGKALLQVTKATKREVKEDLRNFKRVVEGRQPLQRGMQTGLPGQGELEEISGTEAGTMLGSLAVPLVTGIAGGVAAYYAYNKATKGFSLTDPSSWVRVPAANLARWRVGAVQSPFVSKQPISTPAAVASWTLVGASAASIVGAASLRFANQRKNALFVGQWAPTFLGMALLVRTIGDRNARHDLAATVVSWSLLSACLGAIGASLIQHLRGKRHDGLFVGQWAPTFLGAAILTRFLNR
jgi:uncharacterized membrane protein